MTSRLGVRLPPWRRRRPRQPDLCLRRWHCHRRPRRTGCTSSSAAWMSSTPSDPKSGAAPPGNAPSDAAQGAAVAGRAVPRLGHLLGDHAARAGRDPALHHAGVRASARCHGADRARAAAGPQLRGREPRGMGHICGGRAVQRGRLQRVHSLCAAHHRDLARRDHGLHHADLGDAARAADPRRAADPDPRAGARPVASQAWRS